MNYCPKCGQKLVPDMAFCPNCGASFRANDMVDTSKIPITKIISVAWESANLDNEERKVWNISTSDETNVILALAIETSSFLLYTAGYYSSSFTDDRTINQFRDTIIPPAINEFLKGYFSRYRLKSGVNKEEVTKKLDIIATKGMNDAFNEYAESLYKNREERVDSIVLFSMRIGRLFNQEYNLKSSDLCLRIALRAIQEAKINDLMQPKALLISDVVSEAWKYGYLDNAAIKAKKTTNENDVGIHILISSEALSFLLNVISAYSFNYGGTQKRDKLQNEITPIIIDCMFDKYETMYRIKPDKNKDELRTQFKDMLSGMLKDAAPDYLDCKDYLSCANIFARRACHLTEQEGNIKFFEAFKGDGIQSTKKLNLENLVKRICNELS